jgi:preprotein translocase subunit SecG
MILNILIIIVAIVLITAILLQSQGSGLSSAFGGGGEFYRSKRSVEKLLYWLTIITAAIFALVSIVLLLPQK